MNQVDISIVIPVYNSENTLEELFNRIKSTLEKTTKSFELIFCEDCGMDKSWDVLKIIKEKNPSLVTAIKLNKNYGQHNAIMCGFGFAKGELIITMDDDLQHPPEEILKLLDSYEKDGSDVVYGVYRKKQHSLARNVGSYSVKKTSKAMYDGKGKGSSFRLIKRDIIEKILEHDQYFIFIDELLLWYTDNIEFVEVEHHKRLESKSTYTKRKLFKLVSDLIFFYTNMPLKLMIHGGFIVSFITFILGLQFIIRKIFFNTPVVGYSSLIVTILFSTSIIVFSLGVIGGYISRIYQVQNNKPPYNIDKVL